MSKDTTVKNVTELQEIAAQLDGIVEQCQMPERNAIELLSSAVLFLTGQCDLANFTNAVAHVRLSIPGDFTDAHGKLCGWLDAANALIDSPPS